jgi:ComF family protein
LYKRLARRWLALGLDLLFPPRCAGCDKVDSYWRSQCQRDIDLIPFPPPASPDYSSALQSIASTAPHAGKLRQAIHALKFENSPQLAIPLGQRLARRLEDLDWRLDIIVPVPLHTQRMRERGYNQSKLLGEMVAQAHGIPMLESAVERTVATRQQVGLDAQGRRDNMQNAFRADPEILGGKTILLIDDVYTTGATLSACAEAAREAGVGTVYGLTITHA